MRDTSAIFKAAVSAQHTDSAFLICISIYHADIGPPTTLYFVNNEEDVICLGQQHIGYPFVIGLPGDFEDQLPRVQVSIDNIDQSIISELRGLVGPPMISIWVVLADDDSLEYDSIEAGPYELALRKIDYDKFAIIGDLQTDDILNEPYPGHFFTPQTSPGLWS